MNEETGVRDLKYSHVTEFLLNVLLPLAEGDKLPCVRTIMKQTGAGQMAVCHVLSSLQQDGFIRIDPRRGIYRARPTERPHEIRLLHWLLSEWEGNHFIGMLFRKLVELAKADGRMVTIENVRGRPPDKIVSELTGQGISRVIVYGARWPDHALELQRNMKCCLELMPRHSSREIVFMRDSPDMTAIQLDYLLKRGYRRIGYLYLYNDMDQYPIHVQRRMDFYRLMAENGLPVKPEWVFQCSLPYEQIESGMIRLWSSDPKPEALIVPGGAMLKPFFACCRKLGIRPGKDLAVFSCDEISTVLTPEVTAITNNPAEIAETFWQMFLAAERGEKVESCYTELFIRTGQTVPAINRH